MPFNKNKRAIRLPNYMQEPVWIELAEAIDEVFYRSTDENVRRLTDISSVDNIHPETFTEKVGKELFVYNDIYNEGDIWLDRRVRIGNANDIGYTFYDSSVLPQEFYEVILSQGPQYWGEAGAPSLDDFMGFILNADITIYNLYNSGNGAVDYHDFVQEIPSGGSLVTDGGEYYMTSHVDIVVNGNLSAAIDNQKLTDLFYLLAPIHLLIHSAKVAFKAYIGTPAGINIAMGARTRINWTTVPERDLPRSNISFGSRTRVVDVIKA